MSIFLVIFTFCGSPVYVVGSTPSGVLIGAPENAPKEALQVMNGMMRDASKNVYRRDIEDIIGVPGLFCS